MPVLASRLNKLTIILRLVMKFPVYGDILLVCQIFHYFSLKLTKMSAKIVCCVFRWERRETSYAVLSRLSTSFVECFYLKNMS